MKKILFGIYLFSFQAFGMIRANSEFRKIEELSQIFSRRCHHTTETVLGAIKTDPEGRHITPFTNILVHNPLNNQTIEALIPHKYGNYELLLLLMEYILGSGVKSHHDKYNCKFDTSQETVDILCRMIVTPRSFLPLSRKINGDGLIHIAAQVDDTASIRTLLEHRADPYAKNNAHKTALDILVENGTEISDDLRALLMPPEEELEVAPGGILEKGARGIRRSAAVTESVEDTRRLNSMEVGEECCIQ